MVNSGGTILYANEAAVGMFGRALVGEAFGQPVLAGQTGELDILGADGPRIVELRPQDFFWEGHPAWLVWLRDVTAYRKSQAQLTAQRDLLEQIGRSEPLAAILGSLVKRLESQVPGGRAVLLLPEHRLGLTRLTESLATWLGELDPRVWNWDEEGHATLLRLARLRLAWTGELLTDQDERLGVLVVYLPEQREPLTTGEIEVARSLLQLAQLAVERERGDQALRESEERLRATFNQAGVGMCMLDGEGRFLLVNDRLCQLLGYSRSQLLSLTMGEVTHPEDREAMTTALGRLARGEQLSLGEETRQVRADGGVTWSSVSAELVRDEQGRIKSIVAVVDDVSARKATAHLFESFFEMSLDLLSIAGRDGHFKRVNRAFVKTLGYSVQELCERPYLEFVHPDDRAATAEVMSRLAGSAAPLAFENRYRCQAGGYRTLAWSAYPVEEGHLTYAVARDVTGIRAQERRLRDSEERYRRIVELAHEGIWTIGTDRRVTFVNRRLADLLGYAPEEMVGRPFLDFIDPRMREDGLRRFELRRQGQQEQRDFPFCRRDGSLVWTLATGSPLYDEDGTFAGVITMVADISARRAAEDELAQNQKRLAAIVHAQQELAVSGLELNLVLERVVQLAAELTPADGAVVELAHTRELYKVAVTGRTGIVAGLRLKVGPTLAAHSLATGQLLLCYDTEGDERVDTDLCRSRGIRSLVVVPVRSSEGILGALKVVSGQVAAFSDRDAQTLQLLAESLGALLLRQRATEQLTASERQYRLLFESSPQPMWVYETGSLRYLAVNAAAVALYGYSREEFLAMRIYELEAGPGRHRTRSRELRDVEISADDILFDGLQARLVLVQDITDRLAGERAVARVSRARQTLGACHAALNRAVREDELLLEISRIVVELGGYQMAWVGYAEPDGRRRIQPRACAGESAEYLSRIELTWGEGELGPAAQAIRTGLPAVIPDVEQEPTLHPWLPVMQEYGYRCMVALPLIHNDQAFGILGLYGGDLRPFPPDEVELLVELADALAFGIATLRLRLRQQRTHEAILAVARGVSSGAGHEFYDLLAHSLVDALGADMGLLALVDGERSEARTVSLWVDGTRVADRTFALAEPCRDCLQQPHWVYPRDVQQLFPQVNWHIDCQGYAGAPLLNSEGEVVGMLAALFRQPMPEGDFAISIIQILASRAGAELERQRADARVREQASLLDKARDAILVRDLDCRVTYWNQSSEQLYGYSAQEALGSLLVEELTPEPEAFRKAFAATLKAGDWVGELDQVTREGRKLTVEGRWTLVRDDHGHPRAVLCINTDVTERKELERQFLRAQRLESIGTLAAGIAHDLNNTLSPIMMAVELLALGTDRAADLELLELLRQSTQRGAEMVRQVLNFARGVEVKRSAFDPGALAQDVGRLVRDTFDRKIAVRVHVEAQVWAVDGDPTQLHQVLLNLCVNARDAMPAGGDLTIAVDNLTVDDAFAAMRPDARPGSYVRLTVSDTGEGMAPEVMGRIFDPFFTTKEVGKGTGLGLSTVQAIVKSHGGFMTVYSEPRRGSAFKVYLPVSADTPQSEAPGEEMPRGRGELILVVEDEASARHVTCQILLAFGYQVLAAENGAEAVALFAVNAQIALVLTDVMMPVMDGLATICALQRLRPDVRIVASSGLGDSNWGRVASLGVNHFLAKPYTAQTLLRTLRLALEE